ncbi:ethylene-responsive transcription factor erf110 [Phtheirospermum japonicum]|uniref:Ethylene-responsive transcription factor erf110 n=1 Tax=Phtheirospermum japonicum TaxID=374723 RepID=A0A830BSB3_9LAMI|nr:ethylene-responsive transcription factor erf110 [Phtheirospermum japonicum]
MQQQEETPGYLLSAVLAPPPLLPGQHGQPRYGGAGTSTMSFTPAGGFNIPPAVDSPNSTYSSSSSGSWAGQKRLRDQDDSISQFPDLAQRVYEPEADISFAALAAAVSAAPPPAPAAEPEPPASFIGRDQRNQEEEIQRRPSQALGQICRRDKGPTQSHPSLARHLRHGGGRRPSLRRGGPRLPRQPCQAQLPGKRAGLAATATATSAASSPFRIDRPLQPSVSAARHPIPAVVIPRRRQGLLGILTTASEHRRVISQCRKSKLGACGQSMSTMSFVKLSYL